MALFTDQNTRRYARAHMPKPSVANGPWGEAITHLLNDRNLSQADLVRLINDESLTKRYHGRIVQQTAINRIVRGCPTQTRVLGRIAEALSVTFEEVLVAPGRRLQNEQRERMAQEIESRVLREMESRVGGVVDDQSAELAVRFQRLSPTRRKELENLIGRAERIEQETADVGKTTTERK